MSLSVSYLATKNFAVEGTPKGFFCSWCGQHEAEFDFNFSANFMGYTFLKANNQQKGLCRYCYAFLKERAFRSKSWILRDAKVDFVKPKDAYNFLLNPTFEKYWFVYITNKGQKQSWLSSILHLNTSKERFYCAFEPFDYPILFQIDRLKEMNDTAVFLRQCKISKTELKTGLFNPKTWEKAIRDNFEDILKKIKQEYANTPDWEVVVYGVK